MNAINKLIEEIKENSILDEIQESAIKEILTKGSQSGNIKGSCIMLRGYLRGHLAKHKEYLFKTLPEILIKNGFIEKAYIFADDINDENSEEYNLYEEYLLEIDVELEIEKSEKAKKCLDKMDRYDCKTNQDYQKKSWKDSSS